MLKIKYVGLLGVLAVSGIARADLNDGLVAYYPFDGNSNDYSIYKNHGILQGAINGGPKSTAGFTGKPNTAYLFDGVDDYIRVPDSEELNPVNQLTISFWVRVDAFLNDWMPVAHKGIGVDEECYKNRSYSVWVSRFTPQYVHGTIADGSNCQEYINSRNKISTNEWYHVSFVSDLTVRHEINI